MRGREVRNYWQLRIRTLDWAEKQLVSFLDLPGIGKATVNALYQLEVDTVSKLIAADADELAKSLSAFGLPHCKPEKAADVVRGWQAEARRLWAERESR